MLLGSLTMLMKLLKAPGSVKKIQVGGARVARWQEDHFWQNSGAQMDGSGKDAVQGARVAQILGGDVNIKFSSVLQ